MAQDNSNSTMEMGTSDQVLVATKRKKRLTFVLGGIAMLVVIGVVITLVVVLSGNEGGVSEPIVSTTEGSTSVTTPSTTSTTTVETTTPDTITEPTTPDLGPDPIDLDEIINGVFSSASFNGTWTSENELLFRNANGDLVLYDVDTNSTTALISNTSQILQQSSRVTQLSPDGSQVILSYNVAPVYRYSFLARYAAFDIVTGEVTEILPPLIPSNEAFLQNFVWGPSGTALAFVYLNDIYYQYNLTADPQRITTNGKLNVIYNGIPDWVYEEEVFGSNNALWFSEDGTRLAYATFDDTGVRVMRVPHYGVPGSVDYQYTQHHEIRYPKSGTTNPTVTVTLRDLSNTDTNPVYTVYSAPTDLNEPILKMVRFVTNDTIALMWTNRVQTTLRVVLCTLGETTCEQIYQYTETDGWIDNIPLMFNEESFITILPQSVNGVLYKQIVQVTNGVNGWTARDRTNTAHTVAEIMLWTKDDVVWYKATHVRDSAEQHVYKSEADGTVSCFTCGLQRTDGDECLYNDATISSGGERITVHCAGPGVPQVFIYDTDGTMLRTWDDNAETASLLASRALPSSVRLTVPLETGDADVHIQVPANYENRTNVPLLVYVYGGPDTALVTKQWSIDWGTSLVSRWGVAVAHIDGRGSGLRGVANMFAVNRRLGTVEIQDQIAVTKFLQENLSWVDANRTCIWGWSYGGYAATLALARGGDVFRCAAAVAPVVDWRFYDTIYTERYMDTPANNAQGYIDSSVLSDDVVTAFRDKSYFLIHGTADDNVHYQHAMLISRLLQRQDVFFTQMSYTDEDHGLIGVRPHLYHALEKFLQENML